MKKLFTILLLAAALMVSAAPASKGKQFKIAVSGEAYAQIVIDEASDRVVRRAAQELQNYFRLISGTRIPIINKVVGFKTPMIILATADSPLVKPYLKGQGSVLVKQIKDDGYAVLARNNRLLIIGAVDG